jgi:hypothetical protein
MKGSYLNIFQRMCGRDERKPYHLPQHDRHILVGIQPMRLNRESMPPVLLSLPADERKPPASLELA